MECHEVPVEKREELSSFALAHVYLAELADLRLREIANSDTESINLAEVAELRSEQLKHQKIGDMAEMNLVLTWSCPACGRSPGLEFCVTSGFVKAEVADVLKEKMATTGFVSRDDLPGDGSIWTDAVRESSTGMSAVALALVMTHGRIRDGEAHALELAPASAFGPIPTEVPDDLTVEFPE